MLSPQYKTNRSSLVSQNFSVCIVPVFVMLVCAYVCAGDVFLRAHVGAIVCAYVCAGDIFLRVHVGARGHWVSLFPRGRLPTASGVHHLPASQNGWPASCNDPVSASCPHGAGVTATLGLSMGAGDPRAGPHVCAASVPALWASPQSLLLRTPSPAT